MVWRSAEVAAPAERLWDLLVDLDRWPVWGPTIRSATLDDGGRRLHAEARGRAKPVLGPAVPFRVTDWREGERWAWRVVGVPATAHRVEDLGGDRARVALGTPAWSPAYLPVLEIAVRRLAHLAANP